MQPATSTGANFNIGRDIPGENRHFVIAALADDLKDLASCSPALAHAISFSAQADQFAFCGLALHPRCSEFIP